MGCVNNFLNSGVDILNFGEGMGWDGCVVFFCCVFMLFYYEFSGKLFWYFR